MGKTLGTLALVFGLLVGGCNEKPPASKETYLENNRLVRVQEYNLDDMNGDGIVDRVYSSGSSPASGFMDTVGIPENKRKFGEGVTKILTPELRDAATDLRKSTIVFRWAMDTIRYQRQQEIWGSDTTNYQIQ